MSHWITNHGLTGEDPIRMGTSNSILCPLRVFPTRTQPIFIAGTNDAFWQHPVHGARQAGLAGRQALRHQRRPRRQPRHPRADDRGILPAAHLRRASGQADPRRHGLLGRLQDQRGHGEPARQGARQRAGDRLSRRRAGEVGQQSHQALRRAGRDAPQVADGGRAHGRDHARSGLSATPRSRPCATPRPSPRHEDRLFRQARPARPADLLRARRQAAQRRAARARRAPAGGGQGRRPRGRGAQGATARRRPRPCTRPSTSTSCKTIARDWAKLPNASAEVVPNVHPARYPATYPKALAGRAGWHQVDLACPIGPHTWDAALAASELAATAADLVLGGAREAYALCRPPGHHAYADMAGGFCFLNNTAIAAQRLRGKHQRVAVLDVDVHHGNGTQGIFFERDDVLTVSIHADPGQLLSLLLGPCPRDRRRQGPRLQPQPAAAAGFARRAVARGGRQGAGAHPRLRSDRAGRGAGARRQRKRSAAGPQGDRRGLPRHGREDRAASACRRCWCRKAAISATISAATSCSSWPASRRAAHSAERRSS